MLKKTALIAILVATLGACAMQNQFAPRVLGVADAPVSFDGNVAGKTADYVFVLVPDDNPATPGLSMRTGDTLHLILPGAFKRNGQVAVKSDADTNIVLTRGWPQAAVKQEGQYKIGYDQTNNSMSLSALKEISADGPDGPGIKIIHLRGRTFVNPEPGDYPVTVEHVTVDGARKTAWAGAIKVLERAPAARLAPTNFHLAPGVNSNFQKAPTGQSMPHYLGLLLWGEGGSALDHVGIAPRDLSRFPRYTGGLLVQDVNGDKVLDALVDKVVGGIIGAAFPAAGGGGTLNAGLLTILFRAGDKPGLYRPAFELIGGNSYQFTLEAVDGRPQ